MFWCQKKVAWPHDSVLGGVTRQRMTYDQLSLTQFIQGFTRNILDESDGSVREQMLWYLNDLMEDATDFSWASAKAAHAVLLCEMERHSVLVRYQSHRPNQKGSCSKAQLWQAKLG